MKRIYIIKELWLDPLENRVFNAIGYRDIGFTSDENLVGEISLRSPIVAQSNCWAMPFDMKRFTCECRDELTSDSEKLRALWSDEEQ